MTGNIVLCGFMGSGKTTVGKHLAKLLGRGYCDLDQYIEESEGIPIPEIFEKYGEAGFRQRETQAVTAVSEKVNLVIASGGGTVLFPQNVEAFHAAGSRIVFLDVSAEVLQERLKDDRRRPLLQKNNRNQVIADMLQQRYPLYLAAADVTVDGSASPLAVAKKIAAMKL